MLYRSFNMVAENATHNILNMKLICVGELLMSKAIMELERV